MEAILATLDYVLDTEFNSVCEELTETDYPYSLAVIDSNLCCAYLLEHQDQLEAAIQDLERIPRVDTSTFVTALKAVKELTRLSPN